jgi:hypothetical protein
VNEKLILKKPLVDMFGKNSKTLFLKKPITHTRVSAQGKPKFRFIVK